MLVCHQSVQVFLSLYKVYLLSNNHLDHKKHNSRTLTVRYIPNPRMILPVPYLC